MEEGSGAEEGEEAGMVHHQRRSPRGGALDPMTMEPSMLARKAEQVDCRSGATVESGVVYD
jgi:hypothetical protein